MQYKNSLADAPDVTLTCKRNALFLIISNDKEKMKASIQIDGNAAHLDTFADSLNQLKRGKIGDFNIIEP